MFQMMGSVISPKFTKKIFWIDSLERLTAHINLGVLDIPEVIQIHNSQIGPPTINKEFGIAIRNRDDCKDVSIIVRECCQFIQSEGITSQ